MTAADYSWLRRQSGAPPLVVAHRGASGLAPENTLAAFRLALDLGAPAVECDVHLSADGAPVIIHDERVDRTTNGRGEVAALTFAELQALDAGAWLDRRFAGERLPTLPAALETVAGRARLFVELKIGGGARLVEAALAAIAGSPAEVAMISFDPESVRLVAQRRPDLPLGLLLSQQHVRQRGASAAVEAAQELGAGFISPHEAAADESFIARAHDAGLPVSVWTVDDPERMLALAGLGVDALTTNRPDVALARMPHLSEKGSAR